MDNSITVKNLKEEMTEIEFLNSIKKVHDSRNHRVKNSYGIYDGYKYYRRTKPKESKYILTESQYFAITRKINRALGDLLISGEDIKLPYSLGRLEIRKYGANIAIEDGKIKTNLPVDWEGTLQLWYSDKDSFEHRKLLRMEEKEVYRIHYNRTIARFANKSFYKFTANRDLRRRLRDNIKAGKIEAFIFK